MSSSVPLCCVTAVWSWRVQFGYDVRMFRRLRLGWASCVEFGIVEFCYGG